MAFGLALRGAGEGLGDTLWKDLLPLQGGPGEEDAAGGWLQGSPWGMGPWPVSLSHDGELLLDSGWVSPGMAGEAVPRS